MKSLIKTLLRETLDEIYFMRHSSDRIKERIRVFSDEDISRGVKMGFDKNLNILSNYDLDPSKSYGIMIGKFTPNPNSEYYVTTRDGRGYYSIIDDGVIHDSTGDQFWVVVRENEATTVMLRKAIQTSDVEHNKEKLGVDIVIKDIDRFIKDKEALNQANQPKKNKFKKLKLTNGDTVKYYEMLNKFETLEGLPIDINDIFDELPEDIQNIVLTNMD